MLNYFLMPQQQYVDYLVDLISAEGKWGRTEALPSPWTIG